MAKSIVSNRSTNAPTATIYRFTKAAWKKALAEKRVRDIKRSDELQDVFKEVNQLVDDVRLIATLINNAQARIHSKVVNHA